MPAYLVHHRHGADECDAAFAAWLGFASPLRGSSALSTCLAGGHELWWRIEADDPAAALAQLPRFLSERADAICVRAVEIP